MTSRETQSVFNNSHLRILQSYQKVSILFLLHSFLDQLFPLSFCFCLFVVFISDSSFQLWFCLCCFWAPEMLFLEMIIRAKTTSATPILCSVIFLGPSLLSTVSYWSVLFLLLPQQWESHSSAPTFQRRNRIHASAFREILCLCCIFFCLALPYWLHFSFHSSQLTFFDLYQRTLCSPGSFPRYSMIKPKNIYSSFLPV